MEDREIMLKDYVKENRRKVRLKDMEAEQGFTFLDEKMLGIKRKIEKSGVRLGDIEGLYVTTGIVTGCNEVFIVEDGVDIEDIFCYEVIRGRSIDKYKINKTYKLLDIPQGWTDKNRGDMSAEKYVSQKLYKTYSYLKETGDNYTGKRVGLYDRATRGDYWWELKKHTKMEKYCAISHISKGISTVYIESTPALNSVHGIHSEKAKGITAVLNTKLTDIIFEKFVVINTLEDRGSQKSTGVIKRIIVPTEVLLPKNIRVMEGYTDKIQYLKSQGKPTDHLEQEVEEIVQELYGLTDEEVDYLCK